MLCVGFCFYGHFLSLRCPKYTSSHTSSRLQIQPQVLHRKMSQKFLDRLLSTTENRVHSGQGNAIGMICLEEYNTLNTLTGIIEAQIRLPCGHGV